MKTKAYKEAIIAAHYHPGTDLIKAVQEDHAKLLDTKLVDGAFKRLYRSGDQPGKPGGKSANES